jgi:hypothetical protein
VKAPVFAFGLAVAAAVLAGPGLRPAAAEQRVCNVPLSDWQPRQALQKKLEDEGWQAIAIRIDDGCYKVRAMNAQGERLDAKFDPAKLEIVSRGGRGGHGAPRGDHGHDDGADD